MIQLAQSMLKRVRDKIQTFKPIERVKIEDWEDIKDRASVAEKLLKEDNPALIVLQETLKNAEDSILENRIRKVQEVYTITDSFKKIFTTSKKLQDDELVGQIKFIRSFLAEVESWVARKKELERLEAEGKVEIERNDEKRA